MAVVSFRFTRSADRSAQDRVLGRLKKLQGVKTVGRIDGDSPDEDISRMCFAETTSPEHAESVLEHLQEAVGVEGASIESRRGLV